MITIINYGVGNVESIKNMLKKIGVNALISSNEQEISSAEKLILPGVGAFDTCVGKLRESGLQKVLNKKVLEEKVSILGVCVGMQLLMESSDEGILPGLGWIKGRIVKFKMEKMPVGFKIPHMGWTEVTPRKDSKLFKDMYNDPRFYFVHSYHPQIVNDQDVLAYANYGYNFVAGVERENIVGVQFHPEKSHKFGMKLLDNFVKNYS
jgi:imidazole glycerol-phosphate synthase subunit HisH